MESTINCVHEKLMKLGAERLMANVPGKFKGIEAFTGLMTNFLEKIKKIGAEHLMDNALSILKGIEAVIGLITKFLEKIKKTGCLMDDALSKLKGLRVVTDLMTNFLEKIRKTGAFVPLWVWPVLFLLSCCCWFLWGCCCRGTAGKMMKAPGRKSTWMYRHKFESNPRSYFRDLRGKKD